MNDLSESMSMIREQVITLKIGIKDKKDKKAKGKEVPDKVKTEESSIKTT
ncbi:37098_t:CDS:2 [Gigaspora margarita]|uniref:37098_t:CDS:1 n=1 Tax=Gigaspora margarita TaxID=4874 RepID=A0ABM8VW32_GIGMA|nr:37098_t:CDS:2 [Gigaspora margarita]